MMHYTACDIRWFNNAAVRHRRRWSCW